MNSVSFRTHLLLAAASALGAAPVLSAAELGGLSVHGAVSATAAISDRYNFLGDTKDSPSINSVEAIINGSRRFNNGVAVSAQLYAYEVDNYSDVTLDFATVDYAFNETVGLRAGRVKRPAGLYGDVQDIDMLRPFAYLPLDFYQKTLRPISASYDGVSVYGTVDLRGAGSLDYQLGYGWLPPVAADTAYLRNMLQSSLNTVDSFEEDTLNVAWLFWNLPVPGLRAGYSRNETNDFAIHGSMKSAAELASAPSSARLTPLAFPPGVWDMMVADRPATLSGDQVRETYSVEYTRGDWQFAVEYQQARNDTLAEFPAPLGTRPAVSVNESYYGMASWQATSRWQFGAYYAESFANKDDHHGRTVTVVPAHTAWLKDACAAASFSATDYWLLKAEVHVLDGTYGMAAYNNVDATRWKSDWTYLVLKSTISF